MDSSPSRQGARGSARCGRGRHEPRRRTRCGRGRPASDVQPDAPLISVGAIFEEAAAQGLDVVVLRGPEPPDDLSLGPEAAARLRAALEQGWVAIVPERPVELGGKEQLGWWLVDPADGSTVDQLAEGGGANYVEHSILVLQALWRKQAYVRFGICLLLFIKSLSMVLYWLRAMSRGSSSGSALGFHSTESIICCATEVGA